MRISGFELTRFQFPRDRVVGDSQVRTDEVNAAAVELIDENGQKGTRLRADALRTPSAG